MMEAVPIFLANGKGIAYVDYADAMLVCGYNWCLNNKDGYAVRQSSVKEGSRRIYLHRQLIGDACVGYEIDHIDRDRLNNQRYNLRVCTTLQNSQKTVQKEQEPLQNTKVYTLTKFVLNG